MVTIDGTEISNATIDGTDVSEITVDGDVVFRRLDPINYGFEDMSPWSISNGGQNNNRTLIDGNSFHGELDESNLQASATPYPGGYQIDTFEYWYQETSNSTGSGVRLVNSNGDYEGGTATNNPQYDVDFKNTSGQATDGDRGENYDVWVNVFWDFDWPNNNVDVSFRELTEGSFICDNTFSLKQGVDVETVELWNYNNGIWGDRNLDTWWDELKFVPQDADLNGHVENFESNSFDDDWTINTFNHNRTWSFGKYAAGSRQNGSIDAIWSPFISPKEVTSWEFYWKESSYQTGHVVILEDSNNNEIMEFGSENPQWYLNDGSGGRFELNDGNGNYKDWIYGRFIFDWNNGNYDYYIKNIQSGGGPTETGTQSMDNNSPVDHVRFTGDGYGSGDSVLFDGLQFIN